MGYYILYLNSENTGNNPYNNTIVISKPAANNITYLVDFDEVIKYSKAKNFKLRCEFASQAITNDATTGKYGVLVLNQICNPNSNLSNVVLGSLNPKNSDVPVTTIQYVFIGTLTCNISAALNNRPTYSSGTVTTTPSPQLFVAGDYVLDTDGVYKQIMYVVSSTLIYINGAIVRGTPNTFNVYRRLTTVSANAQSYSLNTLDAISPDTIPRPTGKTYLNIKSLTNKQDETIPIGEYSLKIVLEEA